MRYKMTYESQIGNIYMRSDETNLTGLWFLDSKDAMKHVSPICRWSSRMESYLYNYTKSIVVGFNKSLTGYGGGIQNKVKLLELEGININDYIIPTKGTAL